MHQSVSPPESPPDFLSHTHSQTHFHVVPSQMPDPTIAVLVCLKCNFRMLQAEDMHMHNVMIFF